MTYMRRKCAMTPSDPHLVSAHILITASGAYFIHYRYGFHEIPRLARSRVASEAHRILQSGGKLAIVDISVDYNPSPAMLAGEPYVLEYKKNIHEQLASLPGFTNFSYQTIVPGHVGLWLLTAEKGSK